MSFWTVKDTRYQVHWARRIVCNTRYQVHWSYQYISHFWEVIIGGVDTKKKCVGYARYLNLACRVLAMHWIMFSWSFEHQSSHGSSEDFLRKQKCEESKLMLYLKISRHRANIHINNNVSWGVVKSLCGSVWSSYTPISTPKELAVPICVP